MFKSVTQTMNTLTSVIIIVIIVLIFKDKRLRMVKVSQDITFIDVRGTFSPVQMQCFMTCRRTICIDIQAQSAHMCDSSSSGSVRNTLPSQKAFHIDHLNLSVFTFLTFIGVLLSGRRMSTTNLSLLHSLSTFSFCIH